MSDEYKTLYDEKVLESVIRLYMEQPIGKRIEWIIGLLKRLVTATPMSELVESVTAGAKTLASDLAAGKHDFATIKGAALEALTRLQRDPYFRATLMIGVPILRRIINGFLDKAANWTDSAKTNIN